MFLHSSVAMYGLPEHTVLMIACSMCVMVVSVVIQGSVEPVAKTQALRAYSGDVRRRVKHCWIIEAHSLP